MNHPPLLGMQADLGFPRTLAGWHEVPPSRNAVRAVWASRDLGVSPHTGMPSITPPQKFPDVDTACRWLSGHTGRLTRYFADGGKESFEVEAPYMRATAH